MVCSVECLEITDTGRVEVGTGLGDQRIDELACLQLRERRCGKRRAAVETMSPARVNGRRRLFGTVARIAGTGNNGGLRLAIEASRDGVGEGADRAEVRL
jgi:hypothetical protein